MAKLLVISEEEGGVGTGMSILFIFNDDRCCTSLWRGTIEVKGGSDRLLWERSGVVVIHLPLIV
jgi:hypothetical protein